MNLIMKILKISTLMILLLTSCSSTPAPVLVFVENKDLNIDFTNLRANVDECVKYHDYELRGRLHATTDTNMLLKTREELVKHYGYPYLAYIEEYCPKEGYFFHSFIKCFIPLRVGFYSTLYMYKWELPNHRNRRVYFVKIDNEWRSIYLIDYDTDHLNPPF